MSNVPYYLLKGRKGFGYGHAEVTDGVIKDGLWDVYTEQHMVDDRWSGTMADSTFRATALKPAPQLTHSHDKIKITTRWRATVVLSLLLRLHHERLYAMCSLVWFCGRTAGSKKRLCLCKLLARKALRFVCLCQFYAHVCIRPFLKMRNPRI